VTGAHFHDLHGLFGNQYAKLDVLIDQVAERIRTLGGNAPGTMLEFLKFTRLEEHPGKYPNERGMVGDLCDDHETLIRELRRVLERNADIFCDAGTTDFLTTLMQEHEKMAWILRSVLGKHSRLTEWVNDQEQIQRESGIEVPVLSSAI
jgi:starvation-inducible DNA-binding protein